MAEARRLAGPDETEALEAEAPHVGPQAGRRPGRLAGLLQARGGLIAWSLIGTVLIAGLWPLGPDIVAAFSRVTPHAPDWALWMQLSATVQLHIVAALAALVIGCVILARPKGRGLHKALGWTWVLAMAATAVSSLFMTGLAGDSFSLIHLMSGWTIIALPMAIAAIRRRNVKAHRRFMTGVFVGGLLVAGALTFLPGRFMFEFLLG